MTRQRPHVIKISWCVLWPTLTTSVKKFQKVVCIRLHRHRYTPFDPRPPDDVSDFACNACMIKETMLENDNFH